MTCIELLKKTNPRLVSPSSFGGAEGCPSSYNYMPRPEWCWALQYIGKYTTQEREAMCERCWDREIPNGKEKSNMNDFWDEMREETQCTPSDSTNRPRILDSGNRTEFATGAVRDIQEGKGRCDLMPLDVVAKIVGDDVHNPDTIIANINQFTNTCNDKFLYAALDSFAGRHFEGVTMGATCCTMCLEVAKHFEEGCKKYGENNWKKGIPVKRYINSAVRHYLKFRRGDKDEPHDRAFCWNIMCAIWTCKHKPELNDYAPVEGVIN